MLNPADQENLARRRSDWETAEAVHDELRAAILRNDLKAGAVMNQVHLARQLGVSRTPLREALRMLLREGLIEGEPNKRVRVAPILVAELEDIYAMRIMLEGLAIKLTTPQLSAADLTHLERCLERMEDHARAEDYEKWEGPHREFHAGLVQHVGPRHLREIQELSEHSERYRRAYTTEAPGGWTRGLHEHRDLLSACEARNPSLAADRLARHYSSVVLGLLALVAPEREPTAVRNALRTFNYSGAGAGELLPVKGGQRP